jgi:hypothetical protein
MSQTRTALPADTAVVAADGAASQKGTDMANQLFVNLPVEDLERSTAFFTGLGFGLFGAGPDMASVVITADAQVMLLSRPTFAGYARGEVADPTRVTQAILVLGMENPTEVDELVDKAVAAGATPTGAPQTEGGRYSRGFADLDGHHWEALCLVAGPG